MTKKKDKNGTKDRYQWLETLFIIVMGLCLIIAIFALVFFIYSLCTLNSMVDESVLNGLKVSEDVSLEGYLKLQKELQEIRASAIGTNTLTFLYQFISGIMIGVAGYLIKKSSERVKEAEEKTTEIRKNIDSLIETSQSIGANLQTLEKESKSIADSQKNSNIELMIGRTSSHVNHIYSSMQTYALLSMGSDNEDIEAILNLKNNAIRRVDKEINAFELFFDTSLELMESWEKEEKKQVLNRMKKEIAILGEILNQETIKPKEQFVSWNEKILSIRNRIKNNLNLD